MPNIKELTIAQLVNKTPIFQQNPKFHYRVHKSPSLKPLSKSAEVITLLTCIQEVLGSNFGRDPDYPELFCVFLQPLHAN
jgi:hypothetical protein